jgi:hypothetical protein
MLLVLLVNATGATDVCWCLLLVPLGFYIAFAGAASATVASGATGKC